MSILNKKFVSAKLLLLTILVASVNAQPQKEFDVASIKPDATGGDNWSIRTPDGGWFRATNVSVRVLLLEAFGIRRLQLAGVPDWCESEKYDIVARTANPAQIEPEEIRPLLRWLLVQRFHLKYHLETRQLPEYALVVAKGGAKLTANLAESGPLGIETRKAPGRATLKATRKPVSDLAQMLANQLDTYIADDTGMKGTFDFTLEWSPDAEHDSPLPSVFAALQEQLGLKLESRKGPVEVTVIDGIERASEN